jgi:peptidoglycan/xylan/chitin deacetylase (PgdA/CDA1 family)
MSLDFLSAEPDGRHELEESTDLRQWQRIPVATFEKRGGSALRAVMSGLMGSASFFRIALLEGVATNRPVYVNLQVDGELDDVQGLRNLKTELERRQISATVYVTADYANRNALFVSELFQSGFEIALHGYYTGEQLASMTYEEQKDLLTRAKVALEGCRPCGTYKPIVGFRPQYFSQNEDTFRVLDELGLTYNSGFKVGQLYLPGHTWEAVPYAAAGHDFYVIPISTVPAGCERVYLCDIACAQVLKWTPEQWREALMVGLAQSLETRQPLVVLLHGYYSGDQTKYGYWQPVMDFLDAAKGKVTFVQSKELVALAKP